MDGNFRHIFQADWVQPVIGLTKGMATLDDLEVIFVVPKAWGDEEQTKVRLIGANKVPVAFKQVYYKGFQTSA